MIDQTAFHLNPKTTLVVVIGMQNEYCNQKGLLYSPQHEQCIKPVASLLDSTRQQQIPTIFIRSERSASDPAVSVWDRKPILERDSWNSELVDDLSPGNDDEHIIRSHSFDPFFGTDLDVLLNQLVSVPTKQYVLIAGLRTHIEILYTIYGFHLRDFRSICMFDCITGPEGFHEQTFKLINRWNYWNVFVSQTKLITFGNGGEASGRTTTSQGPGRIIRTVKN